MTIFQPAESTSAFLKMGIMGKQGSGKSYTAGLISIGLIKHLKSLGISYASKPVAFFDTETGSDWLIPLFKANGIPLVVAKKKSFADLLEAVRWAEQNASALIIDSITHPWRELLESYMKSKKRTFLQIDDWGYLKGQYGWAQFTDLYINSKLHIIMCGRAGDDTEQYTDENGKRQFEKVGVKMKTEGETGFEPSILVLMERNMNLRTNAVTHTGTVLKDRSDTMDGAELDNPNFESFLPHIAKLNLGGDHVGVEAGRDSQHILKTEKRDWQPVQRRICIDEIQTLMALHHPSQSAEDKKAKLKLMLKHFDATWTEIEEVMPLDRLREGYDSLYRELEGKPSKYTAINAELAKGDGRDLNDSLPDHSAKPADTGKVASVEESLENLLLSDIPKLATPKDCLHWMVSVTNHHRTTLGEEAFARVNAALIEHQGKLMKQGPGEGDPKPTDPKPGNGGGDAPTLDLSQEDPNTGAPAFLTREPTTKAKPAGKGKQPAANATEADSYLMTA